MRSACNLENHCCDLNVTIKRTGEYNNWYMIYIGLLGITYSLSYRMTTLKWITFEIFYLLWCTDLKLVNIINLFWFLSVIVFLILLLIFNLIFCLLLTWLADCQDADCQDTWTLPLVLWLISKHGEMVHVWISFWGILYLKWHLWTWVFKFAFMHLLLLLSDWFESANHFALVLSWSFQGLWWKSEVTSKIDIGNKGQSGVYSNACLCVKVFLIGIYLKSNHLTMITSKNCIEYQILHLSLEHPNGLPLLNEKFLLMEWLDQIWIILSWNYNLKPDQSLVLSGICHVVICGRKQGVG